MLWTGALAVWMGCQGGATISPIDDDVDPVLPVIEAVPTFVQFGAPGPGDVAPQTVSFRNVSDTTLRIDEVDFAGAADFRADAGFTWPLQMKPGEAVDVVVRFEPQGVGDRTATLTVKSNAKNANSLEIPVEGKALGPKLEIDPETIDLGPVGLGCLTLRAVTLKNVGRRDLTVSDVALADTPASVRLGVPWAQRVLEPGDEHRFSVIWEPTEDEADTNAEITASLVVTSDDPDSPGVVPVVAKDAFTELVTETFTTPTVRPSDIVLAIDQSCSMQESFAMGPSELDDIAADLPVFIDILDNASVDWRLGVLTGRGTGCFEQGWLEPSQMDWETRLAAAVVTLTDTAPTMEGAGVLTEALLEATRDVLANDRVGGCIEGFRRPDIPLHVIVMSDERDQSTGYGASETYWQPYVDAFETYAGRARDLTVHAVIDRGQGCGGDPFTGAGYEEAADATGGLVRDICQPYFQSFTDIAAEAREVPGYYALTAWDLDPTSIRVWVNGTEWTEDWHHQPVGNAVVFDADLPNGATIEVQYTRYVDCAS